MTRKMKDSGVEWVGMIPDGWKCPKLKTICTCKGRIGFRGYTVEDLVDEGDGAITLSPTNIVDSKLSLAKCSYISWDKYYESPEIMVNEGDVILVKTASVGKCTIYTSSLPATVNPQFVVFKDVNCSNRFLYYNLQSDYIQKQIKLSCMGSVIPTLTQGEILSYRIPLPSLADQERIADYLDAKCASIDDVIAKTNESIEEYKKLKQAVITEAVTKGVRGKRPMKDSDVDWIGQIPKEWTVCKIKHCAFLKTGTTPKNFESLFPDDVLVNWFTPSDISEDGCILFESERKLSQRVIDAENIRVFPKGSILFVGIGALAGKAGFMQTTGYSNQQITAIIPKNNYMGKYLYYFIIADRKRLRDNAYFTTLPIINNGYLSTVFSLCPPLDEQQEIADYLDSKCAAIDTLISKKQQFIDELAAYKKSLIYEYVTGKKEVPA